MENLTKENFFNKMQEKYPKAMYKFCKWIDEYKEKNNWGDLFKTPLEEGFRQLHYSRKYHELPLAMQVGIFMEFMEDIGIIGSYQDPRSLLDRNKQHLEEVFNRVEKTLKL